MNKFLNNIYHYYAPNWIKKLYRGKMFRHEYKMFMANGIEENCEKEFDYVKKSKWIPVIPYEWTESYRARDYKINKDYKGYFCTIGGKKLYLPDESSAYSEAIARIMAEQDIKSPHLYFDKHVSINDGCVLFDIGAAEGLITLLNIDKIKKAYLFECDKVWISALQKTFEPYSDKVKIVNKFVSDVDDENHTTLVQFLKSHSADDVILKMDIEGMETKVVEQGLGDYLGASNIKFSCCTYHFATDAEKLKYLFENRGYKTELSDGYILFMNEKPYFRRGVIRAWK